MTNPTDLPMVQAALRKDGLVGDTDQIYRSACGSFLLDRRLDHERRRPRVELRPTTAA